MYASSDCMSKGARSSADATEDIRSLSVDLKALSAEGRSVNERWSRETCRFWKAIVLGKE
jgi:hypothetical protein